MTGEQDLCLGADHGMIVRRGRGILCKWKGLVGTGLGNLGVDEEIEGNARPVMRGVSATEAVNQTNPIWHD
jgi:hypothetical protein